MAQPYNSRRDVGLRIPSWQDRLTLLSRLLRQDESLNSLPQKASIEDVLHTTLTRLEKQADTLRDLEQKLQEMRSNASERKQTSSPSSTRELRVMIPRPVRPQFNQDFFMNAPNPYLTTNINLQIISCNPAVLELLLHFGVPDAWKQRSTSNFVADKLTIVDLVSTCLPAKLPSLCHNVGMALCQGSVNANDQVAVGLNGTSCAMDVAVWTTYEQSDPDDPSTSRPSFISFLLLDVRNTLSNPNPNVTVPGSAQHSVQLM